MAVKIQTPAGTIEITNDVIATVVGGAATDIYGIVGMASKNQIKDNLNDILRRENYSRGVVVRQEDNGIAVELTFLFKEFVYYRIRGSVLSTMQLHKEVVCCR